MFKLRNFLLGCALPKTFAMKDKNGGYWCLQETGGHIHTESHCPNDFKTTNKHQFHSIKNEDIGNVPSGKCAIKSGFDDSFIRTKNTQLEAGDDNSPDDNEYHFVVNDVGNGKVNIFSVEEEKYLKLDGHHAKAKESSDCGENCHFTIEEIVQPSDSEGMYVIRNKNIEN